MATSKALPKRTVSALAEGATENTVVVQGGEQLVADPGPPPVRPAQPVSSYGNPVANQLFDAATARSRDAVHGVNLLREPPALHAYKAELLSWLDAMDTYERKLAGG